VAFGDLRRGIAERYGEFLKAEGFKETHYEYSESFFGNEILDLRSGEITIRFVRDRSQTSIDLKKEGASFEPIHLLLARLGVVTPEPPPGWIPKPGFLFGADFLVPEWPRLKALLS
jgi:hypothetical protein